MDNTKRIKQNLKALCTAVGVAGLENAACNKAAELLKQYTNEVRIDRTGNVIAMLKCGIAGAKTVLLDAHIDEIGMIVTSICDKGFLRISNCGGIDRRLLSAQEVIVHCKDKDILGVVGSKPPHLEKGDDAKKIPEIDEVFIDIGYTKEQAEKLVALGDRVTLKSDFHELLNDRVSVKALDDRAGVAAILEALELVKDEKLPVNVAVLFSAQEEIGSSGAKVGTFSITPDEAIAVDVSFGATLDAKPELCGKIGKGVMIGIGAMLDKGMSDSLIELAKQNEIDYQIEVLTGRSTGTNADCIMVTKDGVKTGLLSIPLRYMHTPVELVKISDIALVASLIARYIRNDR